MNDRTSHFTSVFYFLAGALAGGSVALLVAPQAGRVTRELLQRRLRDTADSARNLKDRVLRQGEKIGEETAHRVTDAAAALAGRSTRETRGRKDEAASA